MGYSSLTPATEIILGGWCAGDYFQITNVAQTFRLADVDIPTYLSGKITHAYADIYIPYIYNDNAGVNRIDGNSYITATHGVLSDNALLFDSHSFYVTSAGYRYFGGIFRGQYDIKDVVIDAIGGAVEFNWESVKADANHIKIFNHQVSVRIGTY